MFSEAYDKLGVLAAENFDTLNEQELEIFKKHAYTSYLSRKTNNLLHEFWDKLHNVDGKGVQLVPLEKAYKVIYDSYIVEDANLSDGGLRLLETDFPIILPAKTHIRLLVTASDVLHCFAVPSLGIKIDAVPGRISASPLYISQVGKYTGQCSEICGVGHGFMPIYILAVKPSVFEYFIYMFK